MTIHFQERPVSYYRATLGIFGAARLTDNDFSLIPLLPPIGSFGRFIIPRTDIINVVWHRGWIWHNIAINYRANGKTNMVKYNTRQLADWIAAFQRAKIPIEQNILQQRH